ncbi:MAG: transposase [Firmicutes bacterium]|nr:transposase [Bacillota bacterium]
MNKPLDAFVPANHLLRRVEACIDFRKLAEPLSFDYHPDQGRPSIPPEVLVRALTLGYVYRIPSFRRLCEAISENLAFRWFLFLGLEDEVFDHSTITVFMQRVGPKGFRSLLTRLNHQLAQAGLSTGQAYVDSSLVPAAVSGEKLSPSTLSPEEFARVAIKENDVFFSCEAVREARWADFRVAKRRLVRRYFQDGKGRLPLHPRDPDARWRTMGKRKAVLSYKHHVLVDERGFILAQRMTHSTTRDPDVVLELLDEAPADIRVLTADTGYSLGRLRRCLEQRGIEAYIPLHTRHLEHRKKRKEFHLMDSKHLICPAGRILQRSTWDKRHECWLYAARVRDCQACNLKTTCLPPRSVRRFVQLSEYEQEFIRAEERNSTIRYQRMMRRRKTVVEGIFAHLDALGLERLRRYGLAAVQSEGYLAALAHNILKALRYMAGPRRAALSRALTSWPNASSLRTDLTTA